MVFAKSERQEADFESGGRVAGTEDEAKREKGKLRPSYKGL